MVIGATLFVLVVALRTGERLGGTWQAFVVGAGAGVVALLLAFLVLGGVGMLVVQWPCGASDETEIDGGSAVC